MKISDLLTKESILLNVRKQSKKEIIEKAISLMNSSGNISDLDRYRKAVFAREKQSTTGVGEGIAIPHGKSSSVKSPSLVAMTIPEGVEYHSVDTLPVTLLFLIAVPNTKENLHLSILSKLSELLIDEDFQALLRGAETAEEFLGIIAKYESDT